MDQQGGTGICASPSPQYKNLADRYLGFILRSLAWIQQRQHQRHHEHEAVQKGLRHHRNEFRKSVEYYWMGHICNASGTSASV